MSWFWDTTARRRNTKRRRGLTAYRKGKVGETKAVGYLTRRGYKMMTDRFRTKGGEIDRIMRDPHNRKVAIEVKNLNTPVTAAIVKRFSRKVEFERKHGTVSGGVIVSRRGFSEEAARAGRKLGVKLIEYTPPKKTRRRGLFDF